MATSCAKCGTKTKRVWGHAQVGSPGGERAATVPAGRRGGGGPQVLGGSAVATDPGPRGVALEHEPSPMGPMPGADHRARPRHWVPVCAAVAMLVVVAGLGVAFELTLGGRFPSRWDDQVGPIAGRVEALRGLTFKHPVRVRYLSSAAFEKKFSPSSTELGKQREQIDQGTAL